MSRFEPRSGLAITDCGFMASADGKKFVKYEEAFCPPLPEDGTNWLYGDCFFTYGMLETPSDIIGSDPEISLFNGEKYWMEPAATLVRYTIRRDGFVSLRADGKEKMILTLIDSDGNRYESEEYFGNSTHRRIKIADDAVKRLSGKPVRLEVRLRDADLYSIQFGK